jgi:hypothetical protein
MAVVISVRLLIILALFTLSTILSNPLSASERGRVFFLHEDVAFAKPTLELEALPTGAAVAVTTTRGRVVGRGEIFRSRTEHIVIRIKEGRARIGDLTRPAGEADLVAPNGEGAPDETSDLAADAERNEKRNQGRAAPDGGGPRSSADNRTASTRSRPFAAGNVIMVYRVANAPNLLADRFDSDFIRSLLKEGGAESNVSIRLQSRPRGGRLTPSRIHSDARRAGAALALVPIYSESPNGDSLVVAIHDAATGRKSATVATPIRLMERLVFLPDGRRMGQLRFIGRYEGIDFIPEELRLDVAGHPLIRIGAEWFALRDGEARFLSDLRPRQANRSDAETPYRLERETTPGGFERIVLFDGEKRLYASNLIAPGSPTAMNGRNIAFIDGRVIKLLRID